MTNAQSPLWSASIFHSLDLQFSQRFIYEWMEQTFPNPIKKKKNLRDCTIKAGHSVPMVSSRMFAALSLLENTEHSLVCRRFSGMTLGTSVAWRKKGGGGVGGGQRTQITVTQTLHCALPQQMGKAKYAACFLVNQSMSLKVEERSIERPMGHYYQAFTFTATPCLRCSVLGQPV